MFLNLLSKWETILSSLRKISMKVTNTLNYLESNIFSLIMSLNLYRISTWNSLLFLSRYIHDSTVLKPRTESSLYQGVPIFSISFGC